jgi:hypothetical protein
MKLLFLLSISVLFSLSTFAQIQIPDVSIPLVISDNAGNSRTLEFGLDSSATDGIDVNLDESDLPPFPPAGAFEARFILPEGGFSGVLSSYKDFRQGIIPFTGTVEHRIRYQVGFGANAVIVSWDFDSTVTGVLQDLAGGAFINVNMFGADSFIVTLPDFITSLRVIITYDNVVPVELSSFTASVVNNSVQLNWVTVSEMNNKGFEVERKRNTGWENIGFIHGSGTTTERKAYFFVDDNISGSGIFSYRLKQIDFSGSYEYSHLVNVEVSLPSGFVLEQNFPNPFNPSTTIRFSLPEKSNVRLIIYNQIGQKVDNLINGVFEAGYYSYDWNASGMPSGIYFYELLTDNFKSIRKLNLIK